MGKVTIDQIAKTYEKKGGNISATCLALTAKSARRQQKVRKE